MSLKYKQRGENPKYPEEIEVWRKGDSVPGWLSDRAKVKFLDGEGNITLERRNLADGGYEILDSSGLSVLARTTGQGDYICWGEDKIFVLTPRQLEILYRIISHL